MTLDDSLKGVVEYALRTGWTHEQIPLLRSEYRKAERMYEHENPMPIRENGEIAFQSRVAEWMKYREITAARTTRQYMEEKRRRIKTND
jgi:hypothetical protein